MYQVKTEYATDLNQVFPTALRDNLKRKPRNQNPNKNTDEHSLLSKLQVKYFVMIPSLWEGISLITHLE